MRDYHRPETFINPEQKTVIESAYRQARVVLKDQDIKITPENFPEYKPEMMQNDLKYVTEMEAKFGSGKSEEEKTADKLGLILEALFFEQAEMSEWLGSNIETVRASRFDDIKNGIDIIAEFLEEEEGEEQAAVRNVSGHMGLAFDVTFASNIKRKLEREKEEIDHNNLAEVRYFHSDHFVGKLPDVPRIVVAVDGKTINEITQLWLEDKKALASHWVQMQILEGTIIQLKVQKKYAETTKHERLINKLDWALRTLEKIYQERRKVLIEENKRLAREGKNEKIVDYDQRDGAFTALKGNLSQVFKTEV
jgi:hypothetical protein